MKILASLFLVALFYVTPTKAASNFDLTFNFGPSISQNGDIEELGEPDISTGIGFNYFFRPMHGLGFSFNSEFDFEGSRQQPFVEDGSISTFDIHYAFRYLSPRFHIVFEPGFGWQTLYDRSADYYWGYWYYDDLSTAFILNYKLFARFIVSEWDAGDMTTSGSFFIGAGVIQNFSFEDDLYGRDISGNRLAALFQVGVGW